MTKELQTKLFAYYKEDALLKEQFDQAENRFAEEAVTHKYKQLQEEMESEGVEFRVFFKRYYLPMMERDNEMVDFDESRAADFIRVLKELDVEEFTVSSTWSAALEEMYELTKVGYHPVGMTMVNAEKDLFTKEFKKRPAMIFRKDGV